METEKKSRYMYVYINMYENDTGHALRPFFLVFKNRAAMALVPSSNNKKVHVVIGLRMEIVKSMQSPFFSFLKFVCDVILFENEVYILINTVTHFLDTMGTVHLSSFEVSLESTNVIEDN